MRVFRLIISALLLVLAINSIAAELEFLDGDRYMHNRLKKNIEDLDMTLDSLTMFLTDDGYLDNSIEFIENDSDSTIQVRFGPRYYIGRFYISGDVHDTVAVAAPFTSDNFAQVVDSIIESYRAGGYYYMSLIPERYDKRDTLVDIYLKSTRGPLVRVSGVELSGLKRTDVDFLRKYIAIDDGEPISRENINESVEALKKLDFVEPDGAPEIIPDAGYETARVRFGLKEKQQFYFEGAAGYIPEDNGYYVWYLDLRGRNLFGRGQRAGLLADSREEYKSLFRVYYGQPLFLFGPGEMLLTVQTRDYRDQFYEFGVNAAYELNLRRGFDLDIELGWKNVEPSPEELRSFRVYEVGVGGRGGEIKDQRGAPGSLALDWTVKYSGRRYKQGGDSVALERAVYNDTRARFRFDGMTTIIGPLNGFVSGTLADVESTEKPLPVSELFLFGGGGTVRGYRNDQFAARRLIILNNELRLFFSLKDYFYPFIDGAYYENYQLDSEGAYDKFDDFIYGYGLGIRLTSGARRLNIEFSWGEEAKFSEPRLGVSFTGQF